MNKKTNKSRALEVGDIYIKNPPHHRKTSVLTVSFIIRNGSPGSQNDVEIIQFVKFNNNIFPIKAYRYKKIEDDDKSVKILKVIK